MGTQKLDHGGYCKWWDVAFSAPFLQLPYLNKSNPKRIGGAPGRTFLTTHGGCWFDGERCCGHREGKSLAKQKVKKFSRKQLYDSDHSETPQSNIRRYSSFGLLPFPQREKLMGSSCGFKQYLFLPEDKFRLCEKIKSGSRLVLQPLSEVARFGANGDTTPAIKSSSAAINSFHYVMTVVVRQPFSSLSSTETGWWTSAIGHERYVRDTYNQ
ncbi:hypothetical protein HID58_045689 [Brassica napus]|uniref:Uncharacterized protein n=1 Tax=Brassica napus TaxID=3708 RepID=A0ABQ8AVR4_BRANA|nr:hypothetical protein HID58_045689 [Brassica napus]